MPPIPALAQKLEQMQTLRKIVSRPFEGPKKQKVKARATLGLLMIALLSNGLSADFYAVMYLGGISLRGWNQDRWKRLGLRRFLDHGLVPVLAEAWKVEYVIPHAKTLQGESPREISAKGTLCYGIKNVRVKPRGQRPSIYLLNLIRQETPESAELKAFARFFPPCSTVRATSLSEIHTVHDSLLKLIEENGVQNLPLDSVTSRLTGPDLQNVCYFLACFERSKHIVERLKAVIPLFPREPPKNSKNPEND